METSFKLVKNNDGTLTFESKKLLPRRVIKKSSGEKLQVEGILHSVNAKQCFVLYDYHGMHFTSKKIDDNNYMLHFPLGIPLRATQDTELLFLDAANHGDQIDVHVEMCDMSELTHRSGLCFVRTTDGKNFLIKIK